MKFEPPSAEKYTRTSVPKVFVPLAFLSKSTPETSVTALVGTFAFPKAVPVALTTVDDVENGADGKV